MNIEVIQLNAYTTPTVKESKSEEWVDYVIERKNKNATKGDYNLGRASNSESYFDFIEQRYNGSTTNQASIDQISRLIYGKGLDALDSYKKPSDYAKMLNLIPKKELKRLIHDRKKFGFGALQVQYKDKLISRVSHIPSSKLRSGIKTDKNKVVNWFFSDDWKDKSIEPTPIPLFGNSNNNKTEVYIFAPYSSGDDYYKEPEYSGSLTYAYLEERIGEYLINDIDNGFSGTKIVNFNNGVPPKDKREQVKADVTRKLTGSTGDKLIVAFNRDKESSTTVDSLPLDNAPAHYQYLSEECEKKILKGHKAPSWLLGANGGGQGLGSNADEIKNQMLVFDNFVIKSFQEEIIDGLNEILSVNDISLDLYFKTLQPLEFIGIDVDVDKETVEEETGIDQESLCKVSLSKEYDELKDLRIADELIDLADEDLDGWELIDEKEVDYDKEEELDAFIEKANKEHKDKNNKKTILSKITELVSTGTAKPNAKSSQDYEDREEALYKVRYSYSPNKVSNNSRAFCRAMVKADKIYRKEDLVALEDKVVNAGFGVKGANTYSIWLYKGGALCSHFWKRNTYRFVGKGKKSGDVKSPLAKKVAGKNVGNPSEVAKKPRNMKYKGFVSKESMNNFLRG